MRTRWKEFLSPRDVFRMGIASEHTLANWRAAKIGPTYLKLGRGGKAKVVYRRSDLEAWLSRQRVLTIDALDPEKLRGGY